MIMKKRLLALSGLLFVSIVALGFTRAFVISVRASCDSSSNGDGGDDVSCDNTSDGSIDTSDNNDNVNVNDSTVDDIHTHDGDDSVTVQDSNTGDIKTGSGNDTININGTNPAYPITGDVSGGSGDDSIKINYADVGDVNGDSHHHGSGNDTIQITDSTTYDVSGGKGDDSITILNSYVYGDVNGDKNHGYSSYGGDDTINVLGNDGYVEGLVNGGGGDDSITIGSSIDGKYGKAVKGGDGNDTVALVDGAALNGALSGGDGIDVLQFKFTVGSEDDKKAFGKLLAEQNAGCGWVEFNGQTYYWYGFEDLQNLLHVIGADQGSSVKVTVLGDSRLNQDAVAGPIAVYCKAGAIEVWTINPTDGHGDLGLSTHQSALPQSANGINVVRNGDQITTTFGDYSFSFPAIICPG